MNVRVRLLLFWIGADDVGGGYIARGTLSDQPSTRVIKLLIGSDPLKAPRKINHWGSATEIGRAGERVFFGFMKSSNAESAKEAEIETSAEDRFAFEANISYANALEAMSRTVKLLSPQDFTIRDLDEAQSVMIRTASGKEGPVRRLSEKRPQCPPSEGFLSAVERLARQVVDAEPGGLSACYVHNARHYTIAVRRKSPVKERKVKVSLRDGKTFERTYTDLLKTDFEIVNTESGDRTRFDLLLGVSGALRGVPVQIHYQPNWWFQVVLNLDSREGD